MFFEGLDERQAGMVPWRQLLGTPNRNDEMIKLEKLELCSSVILFIFEVTLFKLHIFKMNIRLICNTGAIFEDSTGIRSLK